MKKLRASSLSLFFRIYFALYSSHIGTRVRLSWHRLYVRKDEFHPSLHIDIFSFKVEDSGTYMDDLLRRRDIAHRRDAGEEVFPYSLFDAIVFSLSKRSVRTFNEQLRLLARRKYFHG